jgi:hypothetical protein
MECKRLRKNIIMTRDILNLILRGKDLGGYGETSLLYVPAAFKAWFLFPYCFKKNINTIMNIGYIMRSTEMLKKDEAPLNKLSKRQNCYRLKFRCSLEFLNPFAIKYIKEK